MNETQMLLGLIVGVFLLIFMILKTKIHTFLALIIASAVTGIVGGMLPSEVVSSITGGFGSTLSSIGIIIGFGVMMGRILEVSGAAERMAYTFIKTLGKGREELALALTGFIVSIPIFADSGFVILTPLVKSISRKTKRSVVGLGCALACGLFVTHHLVPPTPGPLGVAAIFGADLGQVILWGLVMSVPVTIAGIIYSKWLGKHIYQIPGDDGKEWVRGQYDPKQISAAQNIEEMFPNLNNLPSAFVSFLPIVLPVILIFINTLCSAMGVTGTVGELATFIGNPVIAVALGLVVSIYTLAGKETRAEAIKKMEEGVESAGIILLITGAGGAFGYVIRTAGIGDYLGGVIAGLPIPAILVPFLISAAVRCIQGSSTVAMVTSASISAPILTALGVNPVFATMATCMGAMAIGHFNDSFFWVVNRMLGITETKEQLKTWTVPTIVMWLSGCVVVVLLNAVFG